jgi:hypothetical protein
MERRKTPRLRTLFGGVIAFNKRSSTMDCLVRNFSGDGAKVTFTNTITVPDEFDLTIQRKETSYRARMVWRDRDEAGVVFLDPSAAKAPIPLDWARRLRDCEAQNAALKRRVAELSTAG